MRLVFHRPVPIGALGRMRDEVSAAEVTSITRNTAPDEYVIVADGITTKVPASNVAYQVG